MCIGSARVLTTAPGAAADEKPERVSLVELRNGKLVIKQKLLSFEKMSDTMQGAFHADSFHLHATEREFPPIRPTQRLSSFEKCSKSA